MTSQIVTTIHSTSFAPYKNETQLFIVCNCNAPHRQSAQNLYLKLMGKPTNLIQLTPTHLSGGTRLCSGVRKGKATLLRTIRAIIMCS